MVFRENDDGLQKTLKWVVYIWTCMLTSKPTQCTQFFWTFDGVSIWVEMIRGQLTFCLASRNIIIRSNHDIFVVDGGIVVDADSSSGVWEGTLGSSPNAYPFCNQCLDWEGVTAWKLVLLQKELMSGYISYRMFPVPAYWSFTVSTIKFTNSFYTNNLALLKYKLKRNIFK